MIERRGRARLAGALALLAVVARGEAARAGEPDGEAEQLLHQAVARFNDGQFAEARVLLGQARERARARPLQARIFLHLGLNHAAENQTEQACSFFRLALSRDPWITLDESQYKPASVKLLQAVRRSLEGALAITAEGKALEVWVDGRRFRSPPLELRLPGGEYAVEVRDPSGRRVFQSRAKVAAGQRSQLAFVVPKPSAPTSVAARPLAPRPSESATEAGKRPRRRVWTWVGGAAALAAVGVAIGTGVAARADQDAGCQLLAGSGDCADRTRIARADLQRYGDLRASARRKALASNIAWATAGALAVASGVLYWLEGRSARARPVASRLWQAASVLGPGLAY